MNPLVLKALPYVLGAVLVFAAYRWAYERGSEAMEAKWQASTAEAAARFAEELAAQQTLLEVATGDLTKARAAASKRRETLRDAYVNDPAARDWRSQPIPDSVLHALGDRAAVPGDPAVAD